MAYVSGSAVTGGDGTGTTVTFPNRCPNEQDNDVLELVLYAESDAALTVSITGGTWTQHASAVNTVTTPDIRCYRFWARKASGDTAIPVVSWGGASIWRTVIMAAYRGRQSSGAPLDATTSTNAETGAGDSFPLATSITTGHANADLVFTAHDISASTHATYTANFVERADIGGQCLADDTQSSAGASGNKSCTSTFPEHWIATLSALQEQPLGPTITQHPAHNAVRLGCQAIFSVQGTASAGSLTYQWKISGVNAADGTASTFSCITTADNSGAQVTCDVTDSNGTVTSNAAFMIGLRDRSIVPIQQRMS